MVALTLPADQVILLSRLAEQVGELLSALNSGVWLDEQQVAERFGVGRSTVREWAEYFGLPYVMLGQVKRYHSAEADAWLLQFKRNNPKALKLVNEGLQRRDQARKAA